MGFETTEEILADELEKQRRRLHNITTTLEQQYQMLRLIVQVYVILKCIQWFSAVLTLLRNYFRKWRLKLKQMMWMKAFHQMNCELHLQSLQLEQRHDGRLHVFARN